MFGVVCRPSLNKIAAREGAEFTSSLVVPELELDEPPAVDEPWFAGTAVATAPPHVTLLG